MASNCCCCFTALFVLLTSAVFVQTLPQGSPYRAMSFRIIQPATVVTQPQKSPTVDADFVLSKADIEAFIRNKIRTTPVVVFSKSFCVFSRDVKKTLNYYDLNHDAVSFVDIDLLGGFDMMLVMQKYLERTTGSQRVPRVYIGGRFVGGYPEIMELHRAGKLRRLLADAGAIDTDLVLS